MSFDLKALIGHAEGLVQYSDSEYRTHRVYVKATLFNEPHAVRGSYLPFLLVLQVGDDKPVNHRLSTYRDALTLVSSRTGVSVSNMLSRRCDDFYRR